MRFFIIPMLAAMLLAENQCGEERDPKPPDAGPPPFDAGPDIDLPPIDPLGDGGPRSGDSREWDEWDGGDLGRDGGSFPGSGIGADPGTDVLYFLHADVALANLGKPHEKVVETVNQALHDSGLRILSTHVMATNESRELWAKYAGFQSSSLADALTANAAYAWSDGSGRCPVSSLWELRYWYGMSTGGALLVVFIDTAERLAAYNAVSCWLPGGGWPADVYGAADSSLYLSRYPALPAVTVRFLSIRSPEDGTTTSAWRSHCVAQPAFPRPALDVVAASSSRFYEPFFTGLNTRWQRGHSFDYCTAAGDDAFKATARAYADQWVAELKAFSGVE